MLAYLLLFTSLMLFVCIMPIYLLLLTFANALCLHALSLGHRHIVCLFIIIICLLLVFLILCSHRFLNKKAMCSLEK